MWIQSVNKHVWVWNLFRWFYRKFLWELHSTKNDPCWLLKSKGVVAVVWGTEIIGIAKEVEMWLDTSTLKISVRFFLSQKVAEFSKIFPNIYSESFRQNFWPPKKASPIFTASCNPRPVHDLRNINVFTIYIIIVLKGENSFTDHIVCGSSIWGCSSFGSVQLLKSYTLS